MAQTGKTVDYLTAETLVVPSSIGDAVDTTSFSLNVTKDSLSRKTSDSGSSSSTLSDNDSDSDRDSGVIWDFKTDLFATMARNKKASKYRRARRQTLLTEELRRMTLDSNLQFYKLASPDPQDVPVIQYPSGSSSKTITPRSCLRRETKLLATHASLTPYHSRENSVSSNLGAERKMSSIPFPESQSSRLEDELHLHHLVELMRVFHTAGERGADGLDMHEFRVALGRILGGKVDSRIRTMFMKIDIESGGRVDWDKFCNYMVMEYQERQLMTEGAIKVLYPHNVKLLHSLARDMYVRICFLPMVHRRVFTSSDVHYISKGMEEGGSDKIEGRYITTTKEGVLSIWNRNFTLYKVVTLDVGRLPWVTDMVVLPNVSKIIVSMTNNMLVLFDMANNSFDRVATIVNIPFTIICMDYWYDQEEPNKALLVTGDMSGGVCVLEFDKALVFLFGPQIGGYYFVPFKHITEDKVDGVRSSYFPMLHQDWTTKVKYLSHIHYVLSCSNDEKHSLYLLDLTKRRGSALKIRKGAISFDFCFEWNIIVTGGLDRDLRLWNPYVTNRPISILRGHLTAVMHIVVNSHHGHIFSLSKDLDLRVWNIGDHMCVQTLNRFQCLLPNVPTAFYVHPYTEVVMIGTHNLGVLQPGNDRHEKFVCDRAFSHERPLCAALYNHNFNQVVSACHGSVVCVWDINTGEKMIQFSRCHGDKEITAMSFDSSGRRLFTGGRDGTIKVWNFNNGACLLVLKNEYNSEVTSICCFKRKVIVSGWSRVFNSYTNSRHMSDDDYVHDSIPDYFGHDVHKEDILCMSHLEPNMLASASYDGDIILWNLDGNRHTCRLNTSEYRCRMPSEFKHRFGDAKRTSIYKQTNVPARLLLGRHPPGTKDKAVEKLVFLQGREQDLTSAGLVACGTGGWVDFWNIYGGGLIGEFNIWNNSRHSLEDDEKILHSVTALKIDRTNTTMLTGNSLGYIQIWKISEYCFKVSSGTKKPIMSPPPLGAAWRGHDRGIVSLDLAEEKGLIISASTDHCVRLWSTAGRYIGTFGERKLWTLKFPLHAAELPHRIPHGINRCSSFLTIQTVSGPATSKWQHAKRLFKILQNAKRKEKEKLALAQNEAMSRKHTIYIEKEDAPILGRCYKRKTRFRKPIVPVKFTKYGDGKTVNIYNKMEYKELEDPKDVHMPKSLHRCLPVTPLHVYLGGSIYETSSQYASAIATLHPKKPFTEATLLPNIKLKRTESFSMRPPLSTKKFTRRKSIGFKQTLDLHGDESYKKYFKNALENTKEDTLVQPVNRFVDPSRNGIRSSQANIKIGEPSMRNGIKSSQADVRRRQSSMRNIKSCLPDTRVRLPSLVSKQVGVWTDQVAVAQQSVAQQVIFDPIDKLTDTMSRGTNNNSRGTNNNSRATIDPRRFT